MLFLLILVACFLLQFVLPWWIIAITAGVLAYLKGKSNKHSFWSAFFAVFVLWTVTALWKSLPNDNVLLGRVAGMFTLPASAFGRTAVVVLTGVIGGLAAGLPALAGYWWQNAFSSKR